MQRQNKNPKRILIIAGSDPCGGAGLQADLKVATVHKVYAGAVVTCLTAQSTKGVSGVFNPPASFLKQQLEEVFNDIKLFVNIFYIYNNNFYLHLIVIIHLIYY